MRVDLETYDPKGDFRYKLRERFVSLIGSALMLSLLLQSQVISVAIQYPNP